ncbi:hypothetical protein [Streptomyces sp. NBC_01244]|uniref:hypothetical protein n=1 Tax=Streptomyces sp. NBC_01244 TaxID=2903797 RepID=UPI002E1413EC|nr:hypothetical protein OG247_13375 [Streptomyces sp. NBC_01244]
MAADREARHVTAGGANQERLRTLVALLLLSLAGIAWISVRSLLGSYRENGLGPSDAPAAVASIVSIGTVIGVLVGGVLSGLSKLVQARGQRDADLVRANAEMVRAQADMVRARAGLPAVDGPPANDPPGSPPGEEPPPE